jgi:hypothetical protein
VAEGAHLWIRCGYVASEHSLTDMQPAASEVQSVAGVWRLGGALLFALTNAQPLVAQFPREIAARTRVRVMVLEPSLRDYESEDELDRRRSGQSPSGHPSRPRRQRDTGRDSTYCDPATRAQPRHSDTGDVHTCGSGGWRDHRRVAHRRRVHERCLTATRSGSRPGCILGGTINALSRAECWRNVPLR